MMKNRQIFMESISSLGMDKDLVDAIAAIHEAVYASEPTRENPSIRSRFVKSLERCGIEHSMCEAIADVYAQVYGKDLINGTDE